MITGLGGSLVVGGKVVPVANWTITFPPTFGDDVMGSLAACLRSAGLDVQLIPAPFGFGSPGFRSCESIFLAIPEDSPGVELLTLLSDFPRVPGGYQKLEIYYRNWPAEHDPMICVAMIAPCVRATHTVRSFRLSDPHCFARLEELLGTFGVPASLPA